MKSDLELHLTSAELIGWMFSFTVYLCFSGNKVVLGPNSFESSLIVSEKSKSVVFLGNMKSTNLICSVVTKLNCLKFNSSLNRRIKFQTIQSSINIQYQYQKQSYFKQFSLTKHQTVLFRTVQVSISTEFQCEKQFFFK